MVQVESSLFQVARAARYCLSSLPRFFGSNWSMLTPIIGSPGLVMRAGCLMRQMRDVASLRYTMDLGVPSGFLFFFITISRYMEPLGAQWKPQMPYARDTREAMRKMGRQRRSSERPDCSMPVISLPPQSLLRHHRVPMSRV